MGRAKEIRVKVIPSKIANPFVKRHHYSGKVVNNSSLHMGAFLDGKLHGVMSFGPSMNKRGMIGLVEDTSWNGFIELNRMAFDDYLPKNSESRCISVSVKIIRKNAPQIKWIISFADGTQCGDGTIYRASGFQLIGLKKNSSMWRNKETGEKMQDMQFYHTMTKKGKEWEKLEGNMLKYIYLIDKTCKVTVPILPFSKIDEMGAGMYKGKNISIAERQKQAEEVHLGERPESIGEEGGSIPTPPLYNSDNEQKGGD